MPIDDYSWTNCRKCGHRYAKHIPKCPRCNEKTSKVSGRAIAGIGIGVAGVIAIYVVMTGALGTTGLQSNLSTITGTPDVESTSGSPSASTTQSDSSSGITGSKEYSTSERSIPLLQDNFEVKAETTKTFEFTSPASTPALKYKDRIEVKGSLSIPIKDNRAIQVQITGVDGKCTWELDRYCNSETVGQVGLKNTDHAEITTWLIPTSTNLVLRFTNMSDYDTTVNADLRMVFTETVVTDSNP